MEPVITYDFSKFAVDAVKPPTKVLQERNAASAAFRREGWAAGITSPYRLGEYVRRRLAGQAHEQALEANKGA